jgi:hypothetical protein
LRASEPAGEIPTLSFPKGELPKIPKDPDDAPSAMRLQGISTRNPVASPVLKEKHCVLLPDAPGA